MPVVDKTGAAAAEVAGAQTRAAGTDTGADAGAGAQQEFRPKILAFTCRWCTYAGADLAGLNRMKYPADIRLLRVPCSGRVNPQYVLEALQRGADGVLVCGCHPGDCHYATGNYYAKRRLMVFKRELEYIGLEPDRFQVRWISGAEAGKFRDTAQAFCERIRELGPIEGDFNLEPGFVAELEELCAAGEGCAAGKGACDSATAGESGDAAVHAGTDGEGGDV